jgi:hypothetical protein
VLHTGYDGVVLVTGTQNVQFPGVRHKHEVLFNEVLRLIDDEIPHLQDRSVEDPDEQLQADLMVALASHVSIGINCCDCPLLKQQLQLV